ncbi:hypothetical protein ACJJTC_015065 [Scirpophaga incertulas]
MEDWLSKINESAAVYGWSERQTIFYALPKLTGLAKKWYDGLTSVKFSWIEWQEKLLEAFPCDENYGDILWEMLNLDCITHGIYDFNIKMNVQGARFEKPEQVLNYFRNIPSKSNNETFVTRRLQLDTREHPWTLNQKYFKPVRVNGLELTGYVDFGSECTLISEDSCHKLGLSLSSQNLPLLRGFGNNAIVPAGKVSIRIIVDLVDVELTAYVVSSSLLPTDVLIGQSLTEISTVRAYKTDKELTLYQVTANKTNTIILKPSKCAIIKKDTIVEVKSVPEYTGQVSSDPTPIMTEDINVDPEIAGDVKHQLIKLLNQNRDCFALSSNELGKTEVTENANKAQ